MSSEFSIDDPIELQRIRSIITKLIDMICWKVSWSYGGVLHLDIGQKIIFSGEEMGSWFLNTEGSNFTISNSNQTLVDTRSIDLGSITDREKVNKYLPLIENQKIVDVQIDSKDLSISLQMNNGIIFRVVSTDEDMLDFQLWSLSTSLTLEVYPSRKYKLG